MRLSSYTRPLVLAILFTLNVASTLPAQDLLPSDAIAIPLASAIDATAFSGGGLYRLSSYEPGVTPPLPPGILSSLPGIADDSGFTNAVYYAPSAAAWFVDDRAVVAAQLLTQPSIDQNEMLPLADEEMGEGYTGGLWLEPLPGVSNRFNVLLHGPTNGSSYLVTSTGFLDPTTNCLWQIEGTLQASADDPTPFALGIAGRTSNLFIRVQACDESCAATNLPLAWQLSFFGVTAVDPAGDWNADGTNNLTHYLTGTDPNLIAFTLSVTNQYTAADSVPVQLNITGGVPSYMAVLINADVGQATWQPFDSTPLSVPTPTNGAYTLTVGLSGLAANATQTWQSLTVYRDNTPLTLALTNLAAFTGSRPYLDPAGYASRSLSSLTWTLLDATGATNTGNGILVAQDWSLTDRWHTTNWLQCVDLPLALGTNSITIQAVDWAGSVVVTNFQYIFDTNGDVTPPALSLSWPPDGTQVSGDTFTGQASINDDTASAILQYMDGDGVLQSINGIVERGGNVWFPTVPLSPGTNRLGIVAMDAAGNMSTNNFNVVQSSVPITISPASSDFLNYAYGTVDVLVGDTATSVTVNGVEATDKGYGSWEASNVPLQPGGTVTLVAVVHLANGATVQALLKLDRGSIVFTQTYGYKLDYSLYDWGMDGTNCLSTHHSELQWARGAGGTNTETGAQIAPDGTVVSSNFFLATWPADNGYLPCLPGQSWSGIYSNGVLIYSDNRTVDPPRVEWMEESSSSGNWPEADNVTWTESSAREMRLFTGGTGGRSSQSLFILRQSLTLKSLLDSGVVHWGERYPGTAFQSFLSDDSPPVPVPPQQVSMAGLGFLDEDGELATMLADARELTITPTVLAAVSSPVAAPPRTRPAPSGANAAASGYKLVPNCVSPCPANRSRSTVGVGEQVNISLVPSLGPQDWRITWKTSAGSLSTPQGSTTMLTSPSNATPATVTMYYYGGTDLNNYTVSYTTNFTVIEPSGIKATLHGQPDAFIPPAVGAGMHMDVVLQPTHVSFYQVQIIEPAANATNRTGYFTNTVPPNHDAGHGAGKWHPVAYSNLVTDQDFDHASSFGWSVGQGGSYTWPIKPFWRVIGDTRSNSLSGWTDQVHTLSGDGTMKVDKLGHTVTRHTYESTGTAQ